MFYKVFVLLTLSTSFTVVALADDLVSLPCVERDGILTTQADTTLHVARSVAAESNPTDIKCDSGWSIGASGRSLTCKDPQIFTSGKWRYVGIPNEFSRNKNEVIVSRFPFFYNSLKGICNRLGWPTQTPTGDVKENGCFFGADRAILDISGAPIGLTKPKCVDATYQDAQHITMWRVTSVTCEL